MKTQLTHGRGPWHFELKVANYDQKSSKCFATVQDYGPPERPRGKNNKSVQYKLLEGVSVYQASLASSAMENNDMQMVLDREQTMQTWASYSNNVGS